MKKIDNDDRVTTLVTLLVLCFCLAFVIKGSLQYIVGISFPSQKIDPVGYWDTLGLLWLFLMLKFKID
jgi:hypothetical protein